MFCRNCGKEIDDKAYVCPHCGVLTSNAEAQKKTVNDSGSAGWGVLGFFFPLVGLILFLVWKNERPKSAKAAGIGALICVVLEIAFYVLFILVFILSMYYEQWTAFAALSCFSALA